MSNVVTEAGSFLSTKAAAMFLALSEAAVRSRVARGQIPCYRLGRHLRFKQSDLIVLVKKLGNR